MIFVSSASYAQTRTSKVFRRTEYINGNFYRVLFDTLEVPKGKVDVYFFKYHFYTPYSLPNKFIDLRYKNKKISIWADPKSKKDYQNNWENTCTYDSVGRVTSFTYSGCFKCNSLPYHYTVTYNSKGQVYEIANSLNERDVFKFYYNLKGDIEKFEKYIYGKLDTSIISLY